MTKRDFQIVSAYNRADATGLSQAYKNPSADKVNAERKILAEMCDNDGWGYKILGANTCSFSCAYLMKNDGKLILVYHTAQNVRHIEILDLEV